MDKIHEEEKYDGFYAVTNLDDSAKDILAVAQNRYKIEDCFRIMKTNFDARPVFLRKSRKNTCTFLDLLHCTTYIQAYGVQVG